MSKMLVKNKGRKAVWKDGWLFITGCGCGDVEAQSVPQSDAAIILAKVAKGDPPESWMHLLRRNP